MSGDQKKRRSKWDVVDPEEMKKQSQKAVQEQIQTLNQKLAQTFGDPLSAEIEINDCPAPTRYLLTKGSTHIQVAQETGASVVTRGVYVPPQEKGITSDKPLFLHVSGKNPDSVRKAETMLRKMMQESLSAKARPAETTAQVMIRLGYGVDPDFNLVGRIVGPRGSYLEHIMKEAGPGTKVILRGKESIMVPNMSGEPFHLSINALTPASLAKAKKLAEDLMSTVYKQYDEFLATKKSAPQPAFDPYYSYNYNYPMPPPPPLGIPGSFPPVLPPPHLRQHYPPPPGPAYPHGIPARPPQLPPGPLPPSSLSGPPSGPHPGPLPGPLPGPPSHHSSAMPPYIPPGSLPGPQAAPPHFRHNFDQEPTSTPPPTSPTKISKLPPSTEPPPENSPLYPRISQPEARDEPKPRVDTPEDARQRWPYVFAKEKAGDKREAKNGEKKPVKSDADLMPPPSKAYTDQLLKKIQERRKLKRSLEDTNTTTTTTNNNNTHIDKKVKTSNDSIGGFKLVDYGDDDDDDKQEEKQKKKESTAISSFSSSFTSSSPVLSSRPTATSPSLQKPNLSPFWSSVNPPPPPSSSQSISAGKSRKSVY